MKVLVNILFCLCFLGLSAQKKQTIYLMFDSKNQESCTLSKGDRGRFHNTNETKKYEKISTQNGEIDFYLCKELFTLNKKEKVETYPIGYLKNFKFSRLQDLKKVVNKENPLYPHKIFKKVYIIEKINDSIIVKYDVKWRYYIE